MKVLSAFFSFRSYLGSFHYFWKKIILIRKIESSSIEESVWKRNKTSLPESFCEITVDNDEIWYNSHGAGDISRNVRDVHDNTVVSAWNQPYISILFQIRVLLFHDCDNFCRPNNTYAVPTAQCEKFAVSRKKPHIFPLVHIFLSANANIHTWLQHIST